MQYFSNNQDEAGTAVDDKHQTPEQENNEQKNENKKGGQPKSEKKKRKGVFKKLFSFFFIIIIALVIFIGIFLIIGAIDKKPVYAVTPENFTMHIYVDNVYKLIQASLNTKAIDIILASTSLGSLRSTIQDLRAQPFIHSRYFKALVNFPIYSAIYSDNSFLLIADVGIRSGFIRFLPSLLPLVKNKLPQIKQVNEESLSYFVFTSGSSQIFLFLDKNLIIATSSKKLLKTAVLNNHNSETVKKIINNKPYGLFSVSIKTNELAGMLAAANDPILDKIFDYASFSDMVTINFDISNEDLFIGTNIPLNENSKGSLQPVLFRQSKTPGIINFLPDTCVYSTVLSVGTPQELWQAAGDLLSKNIITAKTKADSAMSLLFGFTSDDLLFSWPGNEFGIFSISESVDTIVFIKIADENKRKKVFEKVFSNFFIDEQNNIVVDGIRMTRIEFPDYLRSLLDQFKIVLLQPYFVVYNNYLLLSSSAETLAKAISKIEKKNTLTKSENWRMLPQGNSDSMVFIFYNLNYSTPVLFRSFPPVMQNILKLYRLGNLKVSSNGRSLSCTLAAIPIQQEGLTELTGFPIETQQAPGKTIDGGISSRGKPYLFWTKGNKILGINLLTKEQYNFDADGTVYIALENSGNTFSFVWAVSDKGTVYRFNEKLEPIAGFPVYKNIQVSAKPVVADKKIFIPAGSNFIAVSANGEESVSPELSGKIKSSLYVSNNLIAVAPRSFDGEVYLFNQDGTGAQNYPVTTNSLPSASPLIFIHNNDVFIISCTESKNIYAFTEEGSPIPGYPLTLTGAVSAGPIWIQDWKAYVVYTDDNVIWKIDPYGTILASMPLKIQTGKPSLLFTFNIDNKGDSELLVTTNGNAVYAFDSSFFGVPGFPIAGFNTVLFFDVDGNNKKDIITIGTNGGIHAYSY